MAALLSQQQRYLGVVTLIVPLLEEFATAITDW
jgi:hypothetical protein